jgi:hypothetical protein
MSACHPSQIEAQFEGFYSESASHEWDIFNLRAVSTHGQIPIEASRTHIYGILAFQPFSQVTKSHRLRVGVVIVGADGIQGQIFVATESVDHLLIQEASLVNWTMIDHLYQGVLLIRNTGIEDAD